MNTAAFVLLPQAPEQVEQLRGEQRRANAASPPPRDGPLWEKHHGTESHMEGDTHSSYLCKEGGQHVSSPCCMSKSKAWLLSVEVVRV